MSFGSISFGLGCLIAEREDVGIFGTLGVYMPSWRMQRVRRSQCAAISSEEGGGSQMVAISSVRWDIEKYYKRQTFTDMKNTT